MFERAQQLKVLIGGKVENYIQVEEKMFDVFMEFLSKDYTIDFSIKYKMTDYKEKNISVYMLKISKDGYSAILVSRMLSHNSHVPY